MRKNILITVLMIASVLLCMFSCTDTPPAEASYTVTFDADGGSDVAPITVNSGDTVSEPKAPSKKDYAFYGWYNGDVKYDFSTPVTADITLTAKWVQGECKVQFDSAGGTFIARVKVDGGTPVEKPADPTLANYAFDGWYLNGVEYDFSSPVLTDITLVAKWKVIEYTVSFDTNGGDAIDPAIVESSKTVAEPTPTRDGYIFLGWFVGESKYDFSSPVYSNLTLRAEWKYIVTDDKAVYDRMQSVLLLGQSNMWGTGAMNEVEPITDERLFMMRDHGWVPMEEPLHVYDTKASGIGLGASFGKAFVETFDCNLGLIPAALGATTLEMWRVGGDLYNRAIAMARRAQQTSDICAILWHQGEGDNSNQNYAAQLIVILDAMIKDLGLDPDKIIIVTGELFGTRSDAIHGPQLQLMAAHYKNYGIAQSDNLTVHDVTTHFDSPSLRVFGYRYFAIFYYHVTGKTYVFDDNPENYRK